MGKAVQNVSFAGNNKTLLKTDISFYFDVVSGNRFLESCREHTGIWLIGETCYNAISPSMLRTCLNYSHIVVVTNSVHLPWSTTCEDPGLCRFVSSPSKMLFKLIAKELTLAGHPAGLNELCRYEDSPVRCLTLSQTLKAASHLCDSGSSCTLKNQAQICMQSPLYSAATDHIWKGRCLKKNIDIRKEKEIKLNSRCGTSKQWHSKHRQNPNRKCGQSSRQQDP